MERRPDFRIDSGAPVAITLLRKSDGNCSGQFLSLSGDKVKIGLDQEVETGSLLKLETADVWILGETRKCEAHDSGYRAEIAVLEWVSKSELKRLRDAVAACSLDSMPEAVAA